MRTPTPHVHTFCIDPADPIRIEFWYLPDMGQTQYQLFHAGDCIKNTVPNWQFLTLVGFYRSIFDTVDVEEISR